MAILRNFWISFALTFTILVVSIYAIHGVRSEEASEVLNNSTSARSKRNTANSNSPEGLLASCQLTNLLLYQALQQTQQQQRQAQTNPYLALATSNLQGFGSNLNLNGFPLGGAAGIGGNIPFPGAINQNLIFPGANLQTYTTTSTFVTKMTTTALVTIPLLFGNKPSTTTITRTKTYDVTTSKIEILTSTIQPTIVSAQQINPTSVLDVADALVKSTTSGTLDKTKPEYEEYEELDPHYQNDVQEDRRTTGSSRSKTKNSKQDTFETTRVSDAAAVPTKSTKSRGGSRKNSVRQPATTPTQASSKSQSKYQKEDTTTTSRGSTQAKRYQNQPVEEDYYNPGYPSRGTQQYKSEKNKEKVAVAEDSQFYQRQYGSLEEDDVPLDEDPAAAQYSDDYNYYAKRLKRGEQNGDDDEQYPEHTKLDREYLLEPSTDGDYSGNYQKYDKCPPIPANNLPAVTLTVTSTETRTITKFLKGQTSATASVHNNYYGDNGFTSSTVRTFTPSNSASSSGRRGSFKRNRDSDPAAATYDAPTSRRSYSPGTSTSTTTERGASPTGDPRAQILRRGKSRYNPNQDYEAYNRG